MKIIILTHGDTDGICAGALAYAANQGAQIIFTNPYRLLEDLNKIKEPSKIIICDLSLQENKSKQILSKFKDIIEKGNLTYIDHHPLPINISIEDIPGTIIHNPLNSTSELIFSFYQSKLESMHARTAIYGAIADNLDNTPLIQTLLKKYDKRTLYMETGILFQGVESLGANEESKKRILHNLASNIPPSQDEELVKSAIQYTRNEWDALDQLKHDENRG